MSELYDGCSVYEVLPGNPDDQAELAQRLSAMASGLLAIGEQLQATRSGEWVGNAATAFETTVGTQPTRFREAQSAFQAAANAITNYSNALREGQGLAATAIAIFDEAQEATRRWQLQHAAGAPTADPGVDGREEAQQLLSRARESVEFEAGVAASIIRQALALAPARPSLVQELISRATHAFVVIGSLPSVTLTSRLAKMATRGVDGLGDLTTVEEIFTYARNQKDISELATGVSQDSRSLDDLHVGGLTLVAPITDAIHDGSDIASGNTQDLWWSLGHTGVDTVAVAVPEVGLVVGSFYLGQDIGKYVNNKFHVADNASTNIESDATEHLYGTNPGGLTVQQADQYANRYNGVTGFGNFVGDTAHSAVDDAKSALSGLF